MGVGAEGLLDRIVSEFRESGYGGSSEGEMARLRAYAGVTLGTVAQWIEEQAHERRLNLPDLPVTDPAAKLWKTEIEVAYIYLALILGKEAHS